MDHEDFLDPSLRAPRIAPPVLASLAHGGQLNATPLTATAGAGNVTAVTTLPNNYPTAANVNNLTANVTINTATSPLDFVLAGTNSQGVTQYRATVTVANATGTTLTSYAFQLGTGTGAAFVPYASSTPGTGVVSFLPAAPVATSSAFSASTLNNSLLTFTGGSLANGGTAIFTLNLTVPDFGASPFSFTLREIPQAVPEPSAFAALGLGAAALLRRRKKA